jgi:DNA polymerase kappa
MTSFSSMSASTSSMNQKDSQDSGEEEEGVHNDHKAVQLGTELFVCTAKKAGMKEVDHARVSKVVYDMSKGSRFFQNSMKQNQKVNERIEEMKLQLRYLTEARKNHLRQQIDRQIAQLESTRDLTRTKVVVDMDMFYAAVEMRDNPKLKDVPLAVGGMSMISTTNYSARTYGVRAAMPGFIGKELCPDLVFVAPNFQKYTAIAKEIREIFAHYDPDFEAFSLDEAYLDLTSYMEYHWQEYMDKLPIRSYSQQDRSELEEEEEEKEKEQYIEDDFRIVSSQFLYQHREQIAAIIVNEMREKIFSKTQLTASAGIAANTMLAKVSPFYFYLIFYMHTEHSINP